MSSWWWLESWGGRSNMFEVFFVRQEQKKIVAVTGTATATALATNTTTTTATATTNSSSNDGDCHDHNQRPFSQDSKWQVDLTFMDKPMLEMNDLELLGDRHCWDWYNLQRNSVKLVKLWHLDWAWLARKSTSIDQNDSKILKCFPNLWQKGCKWPSSLPHWNNGAIPSDIWRSNFFPFTVLLNPKPVRMISERSIDSILLHFRMESRFLRLADLVVQRMPWGLEELEESSDYNQFGLRC